MPRWVLPVLVTAGVVVAIVAVGLIAGGFFSTPPAPVCTALDNGQNPLVATRTAYGPAGTAQNAQRLLREGASAVRDTCPEHADAATQMNATARLFDAHQNVSPGW